MKFRDYSPSLSMPDPPIVELPDRAALIAHCRKLLYPYRVCFSEQQFHIKPHFPDWPTGWNPRSIVIIDGYGVIGFTDSLPDEAS